MILDSTNTFSEKQAVTASAASTNVIDLGSATRGDIGKGTPIPINVQVTTDFATLTSLTVAIQMSTDEAFTSPKTIQSQTIALAGLVAGARFGFNCIPEGADYRYMRLYYTVTGSDATAGKISAGIVAAKSQRY